MQELLKDIANGEENHEIPFINDVDFEKLPLNFQYVSHNFMGVGACSEDFESVPEPCTCTDLCQEDTCFCYKNYEFGFLNSCIKNKFTFSDAKPVIECSPLCTCNKKCPNRVTQQGINCKLRVYKIKNKGFGVQTLNEIKKFTYICEYAGEIIGISEAKERFNLQKFEDPNYIFVLTEHSHKNDKFITIIDPTNNGNIGRFLNHSCSPNLFVVPVRSDSMIPKLCFFTKRDILPLEELCYDYGTLYSQQNTLINKQISHLIAKSCNYKKCYCGSESCIGFLPFDPNLLNDELMGES